MPNTNKNFLVTNYHVINEGYMIENSEINILLNDDKEALIMDLKIKRENYYNKEDDITLIEINEKDNIKNYLELDDNLLKDNEKIYYEKKSIYILHYLLGRNIHVSYGFLNRIDKHDIIHLCSTDNGSSGAPILNLENNKVIGIHKQGSINFNYNKGTLLKYPLNDYINKNHGIKNTITKKEKKDNIVVGEININKDDINKDIQIINSYENAVKKYSNLKVEDEDKYKNEKELKENIIIKINEKKIEFTYNYKFKKEGTYKIEYLFKNNLTKTCFMFFDCKSITNLNLSNFNTQNVINMSWMFGNCDSLTNLNLSNFNTLNVITMEGMFGNCSSLKNLNVSDFDTKNVTDMTNMFANCNSLKDLNVSNFNTKNVINMSNMFGFCKSLTKLNLSNFNTLNVVNMSTIFCFCQSLTNLNLSNFNTQNVIKMNNMFYLTDLLTKNNIITKDNKILKQFESK